MILNNSRMIHSLRVLSKFSFTQQKISASRFQIIKNHSLHTEYEGLQAPTTPHLTNKWRIIEDQTKLKFFVEQGGFPGCSDIGILLKIGTKHETQENSGSLFCLKNLVHMKPEFEDSVRNYQFLNLTGSTVDFNYDVESTYIKCSFFQEDIDIMVNLILDLGLRQKKLFQQNFQTEQEIGDINELVRVHGFGGKGIGMPTNGSGSVLTNKNFLDFQRKFVTPHDTVISMSNVKNPQNLINSIKDKIKSRYPQFLLRNEPPPVISNYKGAIVKVSNDLIPFFEFAVAFPGAHFKSHKMELYNILRVLLGSASSFSSGGPGKGMHSRCTKNLLNREACIESASYILAHYENFGLFGMMAIGPHEDARQIVNVTLREFAKLRQTISQEQLQRAKNILIASIYANIERQSDRLEELTKHINCYGRIKINQFERNIRAVTSEEIRQQIENLLKLPPTFVLRGSEQALKFANQKDIRKILVV